MKPLTQARHIAHEEGFKPISNDDLEYIIWEYTGYPVFWQTDNQQQEFEAQLRQAFRAARAWAKEER